MIKIKHEITTLNTKNLIANSLKNFMKVKPLSKITVKDVITDCGLNRKTFYYHFENIYDLLEWILREEAIRVVKQFDLLVDYEDAIIFVMDYVEKNKHILNCAFDTMGREEMKRFFYNDFVDIIRSIIDSIETTLGLNVKKDYKDFVCDMYTEALAGMLINLFRNNQNQNKADAVKYISIILRSSIPEVLKSGSELS